MYSFIFRGHGESIFGDRLPTHFDDFRGRLHGHPEHTHRLFASHRVTTLQEALIIGDDNTASKSDMPKLTSADNSFSNCRTKSMQAPTSTDKRMRNRLRDGPIVHRKWRPTNGDLLTGQILQTRPIIRPFRKKST